MGLTYAARQVGDVTVLDLNGRMTLGDSLGLGHGNAVVLHELVRDQVTQGQHKILLNLGAVSYVDSHGLGDIVACFTTLRNHGGQLRICNASGRADALLRLTCLNALLNVDKDEATALQAFAQP